MLLFNKKGGVKLNKSIINNALNDLGTDLTQLIFNNFWEAFLEIVKMLLQNEVFKAFLIGSIISAILAVIKKLVFSFSRLSGCSIRESRNKSNFFANLFDLVGTIGDVFKK
jgi:hypothetical protein